jgi:HNH endonuclease
MAISEVLRQQVILAADYRCEYCKSSSQITGIPLVIDHVFPQSLGGGDGSENLAAACYRCNLLKGAKVDGDDVETGQRALLFNPRIHRWDEHFTWADKGRTMVGLTAIGRVTVAALQLNNDNLVMARSSWISVGWHPPQPRTIQGTESS